MVSVLCHYRRCKCNHVNHLFSLQTMWCPWIRGCSGSSWRTTSWRIKLSWDSCTVASSWRPLEENFWGFSSIAQCVQVVPKNCRYYTKHTLYALLLSFNHQSSCLWDATFISLLLTCGLLRQAVCIENSCMIRGSKEGSNGALHLMRNLLKPAEKTIYEILTEHGGFK